VWEESVRTTDIATAEKLVQRVYPVAQLRDSRREFLFEQTTRGADGVTFARFRISSRIDVAVEFQGVAGYGLLLDGRYAAQSRGDALDTTQPFVFRPGPGSSHSEALDLLVVNVQDDMLRQAVARREGVEDARIDFSRTAPASPELSRHWQRTVAYAWRSVAQVPEVFRNDLVRTATFDAVVAAALAAFPVDIVHTGRIPPDAALPSALRRARAFIDDHADQPLTVQQIAEQARVSVRTLQNGFRRELDTTPLGYLRRVRLLHARDDLLDAQPGERSVVEIAHRWGFASPSRFAAEYQELFGEKPSRTLRR
jgi:AraC-like DNA-binding protein